jgi:hypothetical protein
MNFIILISRYFILIPILVGIIKFKRLDDPYRNFLILLIVYFCIQIFQKANKTPASMNLSCYAQLFIEVMVLLNIFSNWTGTTISVHLKSIIFISIIFSIGAEIYTQGIDTFRVSFVELFVYFISIFLLIEIVIRNKSKRLFNHLAYSRILILYPLIFFRIYYISISIAMFFLYNPETSSMFIDIYNIIFIINLVSYLSYSIAFKWSPKREYFLKHIS